MSLDPTTRRAKRDFSAAMEIHFPRSSHSIHSVYRTYPPVCGHILAIFYLISFFAYLHEYSAPIPCDVFVLLHKIRASVNFDAYSHSSRFGFSSCSVNPYIVSMYPHSFYKYTCDASPDDAVVRWRHHGYGEQEGVPYSLTNACIDIPKTKSFEECELLGNKFPSF